MARFKDDKSVMFLISAGREFHSRGPATEKALFPNFVLVRGMSYAVVIAKTDDVLAMTRLVLLYLLDTKDWFHCSRVFVYKLF